jgi:hypothetical protein
MFEDKTRLKEQIIHDGIKLRESVSQSHRSAYQTKVCPRNSVHFNKSAPDASTVRHDRHWEAPAQYGTEEEGHSIPEVEE